MLTTLETVDMAQILDEAYVLADMINSSLEVSEYLEAKEQMEKDPVAQELLAAFTKKRTEYEDIQRFGKYHPDFNRISAEVRELKRSIEMLDSVQRFKKAENALDEILYSVGRTIADAVSPEIKVPSNNPLLESMSGGCGTGGSCGCSVK